MNSIEIIRVHNGYVVRSTARGYSPDELMDTAHVFYTLDELKEHLVKTFEHGK